MSKAPFMPLWVADFLAKTPDLDAKETGAYLLILMALWTHGGKLPNDPRKLQRIARCGREWPRVWGAIERFFDVADGEISQERLTEELQKVNAKLEVNAHNGARGGKAKALKYKKATLANATISPKQPEPEPYRERDKSLSCESDGFADFWAAYPRKISKGSAEKAWSKARKIAPASQIIEAARRYAELRANEDPQYTAHPATWLNGKRWTDEIPQPGGPGNGQSARPAPRQAAETERLDRLLEVGRRRDAERGSRGNEGTGERGMASGADHDAPPPLLRFAAG